MTIKIISFRLHADTDGCRKFFSDFVMKQISFNLHLCICAILSIAPMSGCYRGTEVGKSDALEIDFSKQYDRVSIGLQDLGDIRYIPLALSDSSLIGSPSIILTEKHIITCNSEDNIIVFNADGSLSHTFNHRGNAGFEYSYIDKLMVNPHDESIYVVDKMMFRVQHYNINGEYLQSIKLPANLFLETFLMDDNTLLCVDRRNVATAENSNEKINLQPFYSIDVSTESQIPVNLPWEIADPVSDLILFSAGDNVGGISLWTPPFSAIGDKIVVSEALEDTVYAISHGEKSPIIIKKNNPSGHESPKLTTVDGMNSRYVFLYTRDKDVDRANNQASDPVLYVYDSDYGNWRIAELKNNDIVGKSESTTRPRYRLSASKHQLPEGVMVQLIQAEELCALRDSELLKGELKEIAESYEEDGNPVLLVLTLAK